MPPSITVGVNAERKLQGVDTDMSLGNHLQELIRKHKTLSDAVEEAQRSPASNDFDIVDMKKQKLRLKEKIQRLSS